MSLSRITAADFGLGLMRGFTWLDCRHGARSEAECDALAATGATHARIWIVAQRIGGLYLIPTAQHDTLNATLQGLQARGMYAVVCLAIEGDMQPWSSRATHAAWYALWQGIARRYRGRKVIAAFDLLNEPNPPGTPEQIEARTATWRTEALHAIDAIYSADPQRVVVCQCLQGYSPWFPAFEPFAHDNVVYATNGYYPHDYTHQNVTEAAAGQPHNPANEVPLSARVLMDMNARFDAIDTWRSKHNRPVYIYEFSAVNWAPSSDEFIRETMKRLRGLSWAYHDFCGWPGWAASPARIACLMAAQK